MYSTGRIEVALFFTGTHTLIYAADYHWFKVYASDNQVPGTPGIATSVQYRLLRLHSHSIVLILVLIYMHLTIK